MPEGDTIHKIASRMRPDLEARRIGELWLRDRGRVVPLVGSRVDEVAALGKHLLVALSSREARAQRFVLHVHLGMNGRWRRADAAETPSAPGREEGVRIGTDACRWVCRRAACAELLRPIDLEMHPVLSRLGPDLLAEKLELGRILRRARAREPRSVSELLLDQAVACGIGNVYRNEVLFLEGVHPATPVARLADAELARLYLLARRLMFANLGGWRRTTTRRVSAEQPLRRGERRSWVHARNGFPCLRCQTEIRVSRLGDAARATYWCPVCQRRAPRPGPTRIRSQAPSHGRR